MLRVTSLLKFILAEGKDTHQRELSIPRVASPSRKTSVVYYVYLALHESSGHHFVKMVFTLN